MYNNTNTGELYFLIFQSTHVVEFSNEHFLHLFRLDFSHFFKIYILTNGNKHERGFGKMRFKRHLKQLPEISRVLRLVFGLEIHFPCSVLRYIQLWFCHIL